MTLRELALLAYLGFVLLTLGTLLGTVWRRHRRVSGAVAVVGFAMMLVALIAVVVIDEALK